MKDTKSYWKNTASNFSKYYSPLSFWNFRRLLSYFLHKRTACLMSLLGTIENKTVLDIGCGNGVHMELIAPNCKHITGIDFSQQMLAEAEKKLKIIKKNNWKLVLADAKKLPFQENHFDCIICIGLLDYTAPLPVILECSRVLKNNGFIVFTIPKRPSIFFFLRGSIGGFFKMGILGIPAVTNLVNRSELNQLLHNSGFKAVSIGTLWNSIWMVKACNS